MKENIERLALEKDFSELLPVEREQVLSEMPQAEFEHFRAVLLSARQLGRGVQAPKHLKAQLLNRMTALPKPGLGRRVVSAGFQFWPAAATLVLGLAAGWLLKPENVQEKVVTEVQVLTDTVWLEKTVWRERVVFRERAQKLPDVVKPIAFIPEKTTPKTAESAFTEPEFVPIKVGTSLGDTPELMRFFSMGDSGR